MRFSKLYFAVFAALLIPSLALADGAAAKMAAEKNANAAASRGPHGYGWTVSGGGMATEHFNSPEAALESMAARERNGAVFSAAEKAALTKAAGGNPHER